MNMKKIFKAAFAVWSAVAAASVSAVTVFAETASSGNQQTSAGSGWGMLLSLAIIFVLMYLLMIRPQKKKEKETKEMQSGIEIGDEIVTIGGIVGMVIRKGDDNVVIETGGERNKMRIKLWAVQENTTALERIREAKAASKKGAADTGLTSAAVVDDSEKKSKKKNKE